MLSNSELYKFTNVVPIHTVIIDEASQIEVGDYLPLLHRFRHSLQKLVFIGDDKQRENWIFDLLTRVTDLDLSGAIRPGGYPAVTKRFRVPAPPKAGLLFEYPM